MNYIVISESDFQEHGQNIPTHINLIYFKIVDFGPNSRKSNIIETAKSQNGFFIVADNNDDSENAFVDILGHFFEAKEKKDESENQKT